MRTIENAESYTTFKNDIAKCLRTSLYSVYVNIIKLRSFLRHLSLSYLREHKLQHKFDLCLNLMCNYDRDFESASHFKICCATFTTERQILINNRIQIVSVLILRWLLDIRLVRLVIKKLHSYFSLYLFDNPEFQLFNLTWSITCIFIKLMLG